MWLQPGITFLSCNRAQLRFKACEERLLQSGFFNKSTTKLLNSREAEFTSNYSQYLPLRFNLSSSTAIICEPLLFDDSGIEQNATDFCRLQKPFNFTDFIAEAMECIELELFPLLNETLIDKLSAASNEYINSLAELKSHLDEYRAQFVRNSDFYRYEFKFLYSEFRFYQASLHQVRVGT